MLADWNLLSEDLQLMLSRAALMRAVDSIAGQAEFLAEEIDAGIIADHGGAEALRLLASLTRSTADEVLVVAGHA
jgi:hypothetical protein